MSDPYTPRVDIGGAQYFPEPYSAFELAAPALRHGLIALGLLATLSVVSTAGLITFIINRFINWRNIYKTWIGYNQYVVLVLNLLIADLQQSAAFLMSWHWYRKNKILAPTSACFAQGWLLNSGDLGSGFFVLAIAVHTYYTAVLRRTVAYRWFAGIIVGIWVLTYILTSVGVGLHREKYFVRAGAWCWVSSAYETERLWCHYFWVFVNQFGTIVVYLMTYYSLRKQTRGLYVDGQLPGPMAETIKSVNRITMLMTIYPMVYILMTLPLSAGRMWTMNHNGRPTSDVFSCIAGALLTSCGWVDSLLYALSRKRLLKHTMPDASSRRTDDFESHQLGSKIITQTRTVAVAEHSPHESESSTRGRYHGRTANMRIYRTSSPTGSVDPILSGVGFLGGITGQVKTEITAGQRELDDGERYELDASTTSMGGSSGVGKKSDEL